MDAAYAGVAAILPEQRAGLDGLELAHSFDTNCHKCAHWPAVPQPHDHVLGQKGSVGCQHARYDHVPYQPTAHQESGKHGCCGCNRRSWSYQPRMIVQTMHASSACMPAKVYGGR